MPAAIRSCIAAAVLIAASALVTPAAAEASAIYPPAGSCTASPATAQPGSVVTVGCLVGTFARSEAVTVTITGESGADAAVAFVHLSVSTAGSQFSSQADGSLSSVHVTLPSNASGVYNIAAVSPTSAGGTATVSVGASASQLPVAGLDPTIVTPLLIGGGTLVVAGAVLLGAAAVRRARRRG